MTTGVVDTFELVDVDEGEGERFSGTSRSCDFTSQLHETCAPPVHPCQRIEGGDTSLFRRRPTIGHRAIAIEIGEASLACCGPAIGHRVIAIEIGEAALACRSPALLSSRFHLIGDGGPTLGSQGIYNFNLTPAAVQDWVVRAVVSGSQTAYVKVQVLPSHDLTVTMNKNWTMAQLPTAQI